MELTIAICTKDRCDELRTTLLSLARQAADDEIRRTTEVLVVDNDSEDATQRVVESSAEEINLPVRSVIERQRGLSHARNTALEEARGRVIAFIDDDVNCDPGWLGAIREAIRDRGLDAYGGPILPLLPSGTPSWLVDSLSSELGGPTSRYWLGDESLEVGANTSLPLPFGANMGMRTELARSLGGFDCEIGWGRHAIPGEDTDFMERARRSGARIRYVAAARVVHRIQPSRTTLQYYSSWQRSYGRYEALRYRDSSLAAKSLHLALWSAKVIITTPSRLKRSPSKTDLRRLRRHMRLVGRMRQIIGR